jgi:hypothetical protein
MSSLCWSDFSNLISNAMTLRETCFKHHQDLSLYCYSHSLLFLRTEYYQHYSH